MPTDFSWLRVNSNKELTEIVRHVLVVSRGEASFRSPDYTYGYFQPGDDLLLLRIFLQQPYRF